MKRLIIIIAAALLLSGCGMQRAFGTLSEKTEGYYFDFGKYEAAGFKISPYSWEGNDFTWVGEYSLEKTPAVIRVRKVKTVTMGDGEFTHSYTVTEPEQRLLDRDAMLAEFVSESIKKGADAAVDFEFTVKVETVNLGLDEDEPYLFPLVTYVMKAYLIKR